MSHLLRHTYRKWWQKPRKVTEREKERTVSFLELFYDLVYVGIIGQLTHALIKHPSLEYLIGFAGLYTMVWVAWINGSLYHELHGNNDIRTRVATFVQMIVLAAMAIFAESAMSTGADAFAVWYAVYLVIISVLWWRTGVHDPDHRPLSMPYVRGFLVMATVFVLSTVVSSAVQFALWAVAIGLSLLIPFLMAYRGGRVAPDQVEYAHKITPSIAERFGLLTIIVLGEVILAVVSEASHISDWNVGTIGMTVFGLLIAISMWWTYFDYAARRLPVQRPCTRFAWIYLHLPITMSISVVGVGIANAMHAKTFESTDRALLFLPVAVFLFCLVLLLKTLEIYQSGNTFYRTASRVAFVSALVIGLLTATNLPALLSLGIVVALLLAPVAAGFYLYVRRVHIGMHH